ncbi:MAG: hypothetical protein K8T89_05930 [Planctomycetes bacterium]|nr:hypothetical protein [Planctomycetota bacterium]
MTRVSFIMALVVLATFTDSASAAQPLSMERYWSGFRNFWGTLFGSVGGIVGIALLTGAAAMFIITRGKWQK